MELLYFILSNVSSVAPWVRYVFIALSLAVVLGLSAFVTPMVGIIVAVGIVVVLLLVGGFRYVLKRRREKQANEFRGELRTLSGAAPGQISDPARRQRLEDLRQSFEKGLEKFRLAGKDLYSVPWYVIVGEPGSGKTEAIRHSAIGFPPGMQDEFQGVGGTINMNWWFTDQAVILDTAGRLLFEEVEPGVTGEWRVFLEMLRKFRPNCPINGLLLAIPAESLIKDTPEEVDRKAGKIAQQLETIQRQLDVRFPAYVVVTKCDLFNGFREFFEEITDPVVQHQMMGWSNPDPLDAAFRPELVDEHIAQVAQQLTRRRLGLMLDPVPRNDRGRRADEVDRLYALPHSIALAAPLLQRYLRAIFIAGAWTAKPLFLRGIYFTSSLREGSALDQELAEAIGLPVEQLPEGRAWEREHSYFLRDMFVEKTFREQGLVTSATDTRKLVMKRRFTLAGAGTAALLALLALTWFGYRGLQQSTGQQSGYWSRASEDWTPAHTWLPIVRREGAAYVYAGAEPVGPGARDRTRLLFDGGNQPLEQFHARLRELSATPLHVPLVFRPLASVGVEIDRERKRAQRIVFEGGNVRPLLDATRQKMAALDSTAPAPGGEAPALVNLIRLEANIARRQERKAVNLTGPQFLPALTGYVAGAEPGAELARTFDAVYAESGGGANQWPGAWFSGGWSLSENVAIDRALSRFVAEAKRAGENQVGNLPLITTLIKELRQYAKREDELASASRPQAASVEKVDALVFTTFNELQKGKESLDVSLRRAKEAGLFGDGAISLVAAHDRLMRDVTTKYQTAKAIQAEADDILGAAQQGIVREAVQNVVGEHASRRLFREIAEKLKGVTADLETKFRAALSQQDLAELKTLDELYLTDAVGRVPHYEIRWDLYQTAIKAAPDPRAGLPDLLGKEWKPLAEVLAKIEQIRGEVQKYDGQLREKALAICQYCLGRAARVQADEFCKAYLDQATRKVQANARFPLVWEPLGPPLTGATFIPIANLVELIGRDLRSPAFQEIKSPHRQAVVDLGKRLSALDPVREALLTPERNLRLCTIMLVNQRAQFELSGQQVGTDVYGGVQLRAGNIDHGAPVKGATPGRIPTNSSGDVELGRFRMDEAFHFHLHRTIADAAVALDQPAPDNWTALRLLEDYNGTRIGDGTRWRVSLRLPNGKLVWFELRFEKPLPPLADWPTRQTLGFAR